MWSWILIPTQDAAPTEPVAYTDEGRLSYAQGAGAARNLRIISGQTEIVENEKGLLIDFNIIASEVAGQNLTPGLTANFGTLAPGEIKVGCWLMTSLVASQSDGRTPGSQLARLAHKGQPCAR